MRYRLRTLLIVLGVAPPVLAYISIRFFGLVLVVACFAIVWLVTELIFRSSVHIERPDER